MNKTKEQIIMMLIEHSRILYNVISDMGLYYNNWAESKKENLEKKLTKMQLSEEEADTIKIRLIREFSEVGGQGLQSFIDLILRMDNVINTSMEFAETLSYISFQPNEEIKKNYHKLINNIMKMADALKVTIKNLRDKPEDVFNNTTIIHELENNIDKIIRKFLNYLYNNQDLEIIILLQLKDSIKILEELADRIHDIADLIRVIIYQ
ncbi:MAG: DUF47 domain-containing protein [Promethearchaeota archaeon]